MGTARRQILVVEDDPDIRAAVGEILILVGYDVAEARDGVEALNRARERVPDVILLDLMMPNLDGWAFRDAQRADPLLAAVPVVVMTACDVRQQHGFGAVAYVQKPFELDDLLRVVHRCCSAFPP